MENGSFQKLTLNSLDRPSIEENIEETLMAHKSALQKKQASQFEVMNFKTIPADIRKTSTVDALISQNEDLMARLKVTLLRLSAIEDETEGNERNALVFHHQDSEAVGELGLLHLRQFEGR